MNFDPMKVLIASASLLAGSAVQAEQGRPNIVLFIADDMNLGNIACYGGNVLTPNMDRLAREGVKFNRFYTTCSSCAPSRFACLTGTYAGRCESKRFLQDNPPGAQRFVRNNVSLEPGVPTIGNILQQNGYVTGAFGKWHLAHEFDLRGTGYDLTTQNGRIDDPLTQAKMVKNQEILCERVRSCGFDTAAAIYGDNVGAPWTYAEGFNAHNPEWVVKNALDFIDENREKPFFVYLGTTLIHNPVSLVHQYAPRVGSERVTPAGLLDETVTGVLPPRATLNERLKSAGIPPRTKPFFEGYPLTESTADILWLDDALGAVLDKLDALNLTEDTIFIFFNDNNTTDKFTCYENGANVAAMMRWPARVTAGQECDELVANIDFAPTFMEAAGVSVPESVQFDGRSFLPLVDGRDAADWRDCLLLELGYTRAVTSSDWKYLAIRYPENPDYLTGDATKAIPGQAYAPANGRTQMLHPDFFEPDQLYNLTKDPYEHTNLANSPEYAARLRQMKKNLERELCRFGEPFGEFNRQ